MCRFFSFSGNDTAIGAERAPTQSAGSGTGRSTPWCVRYTACAPRKLHATNYDSYRMNCLNSTQALPHLIALKLDDELVATTAHSSSKRANNGDNSMAVCTVTGPCGNTTLHDLTDTIQGTLDRCLSQHPVASSAPWPTLLPLRPRYRHPLRLRRRRRQPRDG